MTDTIESLELEAVAARDAAAAKGEAACNAKSDAERRTLMAEAKALRATAVEKNDAANRLRQADVATWAAELEATGEAPAMAIEPPKRLDDIEAPAEGRAG